MRPIVKKFFASFFQERRFFFSEEKKQRLLILMGRILPGEPRLVGEGGPASPAGSLRNAT
jgi:hypothetical protein